jgi:polysaccharide export outer membrane protein
MRRALPILLALFCGCPAPQQLDVLPITPTELALGPGDTFDVRVFGEPELSGTYIVAGDGTIDFPLIGQVRVEDLVPHKAAELIASQLAEKFLRHPQVSLLVKEQQSKKIYVMGQVAKPGTIPFVQNMSIVEVITLAGGFTPIAWRNRTTITRLENGQKKSIEVPVAEIGEGKAPNVMVRPGDIITVPERIF